MDEYTGSPPGLGATKTSHGADTVFDDDGGNGWIFGGFSPILALLVNLHTPSSSSRPEPDRIRLSATGFAGNKTTGGWFIPKFAISQHDEIIAISAQMALDGPTSSKATRQHQCEPKQQSTGL